MDECLDTTTIHGFFYLQRRYSICTKIFWLLVTIAAFIVAGSMILYSLSDWEENQTVTTLDSIAAPIKLVQFPTVTICPNPDTPPDNWAFIEKSLNALDPDGLKEDFVKPLLSKLFDFMLGIYMKYPNLDFWPSRSYGVGGVDTYRYSNWKILTAQDICEKKLSVSDLKNYGREGNLWDKLNDEFEDIDNNTPLICDNSCCTKMTNQSFFLGIMDVGIIFSDVYDEVKEMGFGTFLAYTIKRTNQYLGECLIHTSF